MRQYRGKRVDNGEWVYGWYVHAPQSNHSENEHCIFDVALYESRKESFAFCFRYVIPESVGQSIGRKDRDGAEIYGGSSVQGDWQADRRRTVLGVVTYYDKYGLWALKDEDGVMVSVVWEGCKVIGKTTQALKEKP